MGKVERKKNKNITDNEPPTQENESWTPTERQSLLQALREFGRGNSQKLANAIGTKTVQQVNYFLRRREDLAKRKVMTQKVAPIEMWIAKGSKCLAQKRDYTRSLAEALNSCDHKCDEYEEIYRFLVQSLKGEEPTTISPPSVNILKNLFQDLASLMISTDSRDLLKSVLNPNSQEDPERQILGAESPELNFYKVHFSKDKTDSISFNPFQIEPKYLCDAFLKLKKS